ncbi:MAG: thiamine phosphate synthase, partial [Verrucomicrobiota bacterium]
MRQIADCHLYGILDLGYVEESELKSVLSKMLEGGVDVVQLRAKNVPVEKIEGYTAELLPICRNAGIPLIINDYPEIAATFAVDGVHVGQDDQPIEEVREIVGSEMLVGKSTHSLDQARAASQEPGIDY